MYPIEIKEVDYRASALDIVKDVINFIISGVESFRSPRTLIIFLQKSFHF